MNKYVQYDKMIEVFFPILYYYSIVLLHYCTNLDM